MSNHPSPRSRGVEREVQAANLRALGCDMAQGYLFARPQPPETIDVAALAGGRHLAASG